MMKKGFIFDQIFAFLILFGIAMAIITLFLIGDILPSGYVGFDEGKATIDRAGSMFDNMFPLIAVGLMLTPVISAYFVRSHPIFLVFSIFGMFVNTFFSWLVKEIFVEIASTSSLLVYANQAPLTVLIMQNLNIFGMLLGGLTFMVLVFKAGSE